MNIWANPTASFRRIEVSNRFLTTQGTICVSSALRLPTKASHPVVHRPPTQMHLTPLRCILIYRPFFFEDNLPLGFPLLHGGLYT